MIEALFKKRNYLILFKIFIFGILLSNNDIDFINDRIITVYQPICKNTCFDINLNSHGNNYIGFQWLASHNLILDGKTSINSSSYLDVSYHNAVGFKLILKQILLQHDFYDLLSNRAFFQTMIKEDPLLSFFGGGHQILLSRSGC